MGLSIIRIVMVSTVRINIMIAGPSLIIAIKHSIRIIVSFSSVIYLLIGFRFCLLFLFGLGDVFLFTLFLFIFLLHEAVGR